MFTSTQRRSIDHALIPLVCALIIMASAQSLSAQDPRAAANEFAAAHPNLLPNMDVALDLVYAAPNGLPQSLDLYVPKGSGKPLPLVVFIHGGGWSEGNKKNTQALFLTKEGFAVASINYRLSGVAQFPAQLFDCKAAIRWLRANAARYRIDPNEIGVWGDSAGGHLAELLGVTGRHPELEGNEGNPGISSAVQAVCAFSGPSSFMNIQADPDHPKKGSAVAQLLGGRAEDNPAKARAASPIAYVAPGAPPFLLVHGTSDPAVPFQASVKMNDALKAAGDNVSFDVVPNGGHVPNNPQTHQRAAQFFKQYLRNSNGLD